MNFDRPSNRPSASNLRRGQPQEESLDWRALLIALREKLWIVIVATAIGGLAGWSYLKRCKPVYEARATLEVEDKQRVVKFEEVSTDEVRDVATMNTVAATISSASFLSSVAAHEKFQERPGFFGEGVAPHGFTADNGAGVLGGSLRGNVRQYTALPTSRRGIPIPKSPVTLLMPPPPD